MPVVLLPVELEPMAGHVTNLAIFQDDGERVVLEHRRPTFFQQLSGPGLAARVEWLAVAVQNEHHDWFLCRLLGAPVARVR
jgi:hypothetical protein